MVRIPVHVPPLSPSPRSVSSAGKRPRSSASISDDCALTEIRCREVVREIVADELKKFKADLGEFMSYLIEEKVIVSLYPVVGLAFAH
jgi:hypothetical protein